MKRSSMAAFVSLVSSLAVSLTLSRSAEAAVDTHTIFLNDCQPGGCTVHAGSTNAITDTSDLPSTTGMLSAFNQSATVWASFVSCMKTVMSPFDVTDTEQRPATGDYFQVMAAGLPTQLGFDASLAGIADMSCTAVGTCSPFLPNTLAFAFANLAFFVNDPENLCASAAQPLAAT